jgi:hypothetical protein
VSGIGKPRDKKTDAFNAYFLYSGGLFFAFGKVENTLAAGLRYYLGSLLRPVVGHAAAFDTAAAILGNLRYAALRDLTKRLLKTQNVGREVLDHMDSVFKHVSDIQTLRDHLAHRLAEPFDDTYDGTWIVQDFATTKDFANPQAYKFHIDALKAATIDLGRFTHRTGGILNPWVIDSSYPGSFDLSPPAWRYKPSMLAPCRPKTDES